ncbi:MAG: HDIG domain-containing protein [Tannerella sp.]|jgi:putative nucleotidyltransferase with HDIG domain|nr:HDIG domain-containing protein [Tannerella sp.]
MSTKKEKFLSASCIFTAAFVIAFFFPREGKFRYQFNEGKPWKYGLLTAPGDFPIYKEAGEIEAAKDSLRRKSEPYFRFNHDAENAKLENWRSRMPVLQDAGIPHHVIMYMDESLRGIYRRGIISDSDLERMNRENRTRITALSNSLADAGALTDFHSVRSAYGEIINGAPEDVDRDILRGCHIDEYLTENLFYDSETSEKILEDQIRNIPLSSGMVQAGERIVDSGEIVDSHTYSVLRSLKTVYETKSGGAQRRNIVLIGQFILIFGIMACFGFYMFTFAPEKFFRRRDLIFILLCILGACLLSELCVKYSLVNIYIIPFAIIPIIIRAFFDSHTALFTSLIAVAICSLTALFPYEFLLLQICSCIVVIFSLKELSQRSDLIKCSFYVLLSYSVFYLSLIIYQEGDFSKINWEMFLYFGINSVLLSFSYLFIYVLEKIFGYLSPFTLVELSNLNSTLLKELSEKAPGTFQHTLQVSILASGAGEKVGADTQLIRTGALYHDIGKMGNPGLFTENQNGVNPHENMPFEESARMIIAHVADGIEMAKKHGLHKKVIDFISTHHGRGVTKYFYNSFLNDFPGVPVNKEAFSYPGPNPSTKETAILMMADSVEAASRSLKAYTDESIKNLVNKIVNDKINDKLLDDAPLTLKDIDAIKNVFIERLKTMYHTRISYPELKRPEDEAKQEA